MRTPVSSIFLVLFASVIGSFGAVFLKLGAERLRYGLRHVLNARLITGILLYIGSSIPFLMGIRNGELSVLYPMVSLGYVCALVWSRLFFKEPITTGKIAALAMIIAGIVSISAGR
ncbi:MAG TPA: EamA family transporter [Bryobacteraceae bacterium]|jgi:multidrug transporter EmrE-like cation transporter|nr:EamA family transporter [Bryobacteraceae bacterium]